MKKSYAQGQHLIAAFLNLVLEKNDEYLAELPTNQPNVEQSKIIEQVCEDVLDRLYSIKAIRNKTYLGDLSDLINENIVSCSKTKKSQYGISLLILRSLLLEMKANSKEALKFMKASEIIINRERFHYPFSMIKEITEKSRAVVRHNYQIIKK